MDWLWKNTYLAAGIAAVVGALLLALKLPNPAAFAFMVLGILLMMRAEVERGG